MLLNAVINRTSFYLIKDSAVLVVQERSKKMCRIYLAVKGLGLIAHRILPGTPVIRAYGQLALRDLRFASDILTRLYPRNSK